MKIGVVKKRYEYDAAQKYELLKICASKAVIFLWTQSTLHLHVYRKTARYSEIVQRYVQRHAVTICENVFLSTELPR